MIRYLLADDLTGAADSAVHLGRGRRVRLSLPSAAPWTPEREGELQVHDTETRNLDPGPAGEILGSVSALVARQAGMRPAIFKKVDSTLRGNVAAEALAVARALGFAGVVLAPALPSQGRTVEGGRLFVGGVPVSQSPAGRDPHKPVTSDAVGDILGLPIHGIGLAQVRSRTDFLKGLTETMVVVDATHDSDLAALAAALATRPDLLPAGSAGLASAIAARQGRVRNVGPAAAAAVLVVVGTANPVTRDQVEALRQSAMEGVTVLDIRDVPIQDGRPAARAGTIEDLAQRALDCLPSLPRPVAVVASGGDTALALCLAMREDTLWTMGEVQSGMPWCTLDKSGTVLVTKAGGFGEREGLVDAVRILLGDRQ